MNCTVYNVFMIEREINKKIKEASEHYPVILVTGPRQSGKTTLCKALFPDKKYINFEDVSERKIAEEDPKGFLSKFQDGAILDEVQNVEVLLSYIQIFVDEKNKNGLFILTGSCNFLLLESISQSLAGRVAIFELLPLSLFEMKTVFQFDGVNSYILFGGYPRNITEHYDNLFFYNNYINTYVERDVRKILNIKNLSTFSRFLSLCAARIGSILDVTSFSNELGVDVKTIKEWLNILEASYIIFRLYPWYENRTKRLIKSPKLYFYDTGLACALLNIKESNDLDFDRMRGPLFENLVIIEKIKRSFSNIDGAKFYYYRTSSGIEVDLVEYKNRKLYPIEIKSSMTFNPSFVDNLLKFQKEYSDECGEMSLIYTGSEDFTFKDVKVKNYFK